MLVEYVKFLATCELDLVCTAVLLWLAFEATSMRSGDFTLSERARIVLMQYLGLLTTLFKYAAV